MMRTRHSERVKSTSYEDLRIWNGQDGGFEAKQSPRIQRPRRILFAGHLLSPGRCRLLVGGEIVRSWVKTPFLWKFSFWEKSFSKPRSCPEAIGSCWVPFTAGQPPRPLYSELRAHAPYHPEGPDQKLLGWRPEAKIIEIPMIFFGEWISPVWKFKRVIWNFTIRNVWVSEVDVVWFSSPSKLSRRSSPVTGAPFSFCRASWASSKHRRAETALSVDSLRRCFYFSLGIFPVLLFLNFALWKVLRKLRDDQEEHIPSPGLPNLYFHRLPEECLMKPKRFPCRMEVRLTLLSLTGAASPAMFFSEHGTQVVRSLGARTVAAEVLEWREAEERDGDPRDQRDQDRSSKQRHQGLGSEVLETLEETSWCAELFQTKHFFDQKKGKKKSKGWKTFFVP